MPTKYIVSYRGEFWVEVFAEDEADAIKKANDSENWTLLNNEGHPDFYKVEKNDN